MINFPFFLDLISLNKNVSLYLNAVNEYKCSLSALSVSICFIFSHLLLFVYTNNKGIKFLPLITII